MDEILKELENAIISGERTLAPELANKALASGIDLQNLLKTMGNAMQIVGNKYERREYMLPDMLLSALTFKLVFESLKHKIEEEAKHGGSSAVKILIATVQYDIHDIGKNLVASFLRAAGFEVHDLGVDVSANKLIDEAERLGVHIIALSALLTPTREQLKKVIDLLKEKGLREKYKILVGGAPVSQQYAEMIGADGYAAEATGAAKRAKELME